MNWCGAVDPDCSIAKIRTGLTVPNAELNDVDLIAVCADKFSSKMSGEPARLQLQLGWNPQYAEQRALMNASRIAHSRVAPQNIAMLSLQAGIGHAADAMSMKT